MGRRLLRDEDFLDVLADVLDGVSVDFSEMTDDFSSGEEESDSDEETSSEEDDSDDSDEE